MKAFPRIKITSCALALLSLAGLARGQSTLSVTITPSDDQVIAVDGTVNLGCSPSGGCDPYTYSWTIPNASGNPPTTDQNPGSVTFGSSAEGSVSNASVTVTDANGDTADASVNIGVPKFDPAPPDIWYFEDGTGDATYPVTRDVTVVGVPSGMSVTWKIAGQSDTIKFSNNQQQIVGTDTTRTITSIGFSNAEDNLTLQIENSGSIVATSDTFTARAPTQITSQPQLPLDIYVPHFLPGYMHQYVISIKDKFGKKMEGLHVSEIFGNSTWSLDYAGCNWASPNASDWALDSSSQFVDSYGFFYATSSSIPTTVRTLDPGAGTKVMHSQQTYKAGGARSSITSATGFDCYDGNAQLCRGSAYQY